MRKSIYLLFCIVLCTWNFFVSAQLSGSKRPKIGLVLSGGGAKGLAHIGVLKVLEEAGIHPDFIGGTSMGGIVGGLYSIGYSADSLEHLARSIPWNYYLSDEIPRRNITLEEKEDQDRFVLSFPVKEKKIHIPGGVINGQNIENLLNKLCSPIYNIHDFSQFKIPFLCVATDIENGQEVVLRHGYLPKALRATMSIPSIFNPIEIDNRLLVDGGLVNNLPAQKVKEMGADIIIGVNVGFHPYTKEELGSLFRIIEQTLFFYGEAENNKNKAMCDLLISPDISKYNVSSFNSTDSIISIGEQAARKVFPRLKALADSLKKLDPDYGYHQVIPTIDSIKLMEIHFKGLKNVSSKLVYGKLQLTVLQKVTPEDLEKAIERVYSSLYFENVTYEIRQVEQGVSLIINLEEKKGGLVRVGLHYDSNIKSAILLNMTYRNLLLNGSKFSVNTALGENPFFRASIIKNNGWKPGIGVNFESNRNLMYFYRDSKKISTISYSETKVQLYTQSILRNSFAFGFGLENENSLIKPIIDPVLGFEKKRNEFFNYYGFIRMDSYNNAFYPSQGVKMLSELKLITARKNYSPVIFICSQVSFANRLSRRISLIGHISGGAVKGDSIPTQYMLYTGGMTDNFINGMLPFVGLDYMEKSNRNALLFGLDLQVKFWENIYVIMKGNAGNSTSNINELISYDKIISGYGVTLGYDSLIGPIEVTASRSGNQKGLLGYIRIGFYF